MEGFKIDPRKYMNLPPGEATRRIAEDERKHINADPGLQAHIRDMDRRQAAETAEKKRQAAQLEKEEEKEFNEALDQHYRDRAQFYRISRGVPEAVFREELWPEIRRAFVAGEADAVDWERLEQSTDVY